MSQSMYVDGTYLQQNPTWHVEHSAWKARHILRALARNKVRPQTVCEVGCGAGEVLRQLQSQWPSGDPACEFQGYEISPQAYRLCERKANEKLHFKLGNFLEDDARFDLLLLIDLIEHLEDYFAFLRAVKDRARYKLLHIPLDLSVQILLWPGALVQVRRAVGHLHYFTERTALQTLADVGYEVVDSVLVAATLETARRCLRTHLVNVPRRIVSLASARWAARLCGGYSLMVLAV